MSAKRRARRKARKARRWRRRERRLRARTRFSIAAFSGSATCLVSPRLPSAMDADEVDVEDESAPAFIEVTVGSPVTVGAGVFGKHTLYTVATKVRGSGRRR